MEDNGRELDPDPVNTPPVKIGYQSSRELTIMLIGSVGKMRSFKISRKLMLLVSLFFFLYFVISILISYLYFDLNASHKDQSNELKNLKAELNEKSRTLEQNRLYIKGLEEFYNDTRKKVEEKEGAELALTKTSESKSPKIKSSDEKKSRETTKKSPETKTDTGTIGKKDSEQNNPAGNVTAEVINQETTATEMKGKADTAITQDETQEPKSLTLDVSAEVKSQKTTEKEIKEDSNTGITPEPPAQQGEPEADISGDAEKPSLDIIKGADSYLEIRDIKFQRTDSRLTLDFRLVNMLADEKSAEGYIHIIVMDKDKEYPSEWNSSFNKLEDGFPTDYKHGQQFIIQRFRPYQRQYEKNPDSELPSIIRILVYDRSGQKVLEKEFAVTDESDNVPS